MIARRLKLTPLAARELKTWPRFMFNYAFGLVGSDPYRFRDGTRLKIGRGVDHVPIIEVFLRRDYGEIAENALILDLGANIGAFSIYAAMHARNVRVYAYEPAADFFHLLEENVRMNGLDRVVTCFNLAVAAASQSRPLFVSGGDILFPTLLGSESGSTENVYHVPCITLGEILALNGLENVDLLKMDCEGAEYEIFYNTAPTSFERIREIRMEYHNLDDKTHNVSALTAFLRERSYDVALSVPTAPNSGNLWMRRYD